MPPKKTTTASGASKTAAKTTSKSTGKTKAGSSSTGAKPKQSTAGGAAAKPDPPKAVKRGKHRNILISYLHNTEKHVYGNIYPLVYSSSSYY